MKNNANLVKFELRNGSYGSKIEKVSPRAHFVGFSDIKARVLTLSSQA